MRGRYLSKPKLFMMIGLPASGKSSKAKELSEKYNAKIHASDEIRTEFGDVQNQDTNQKVFQELHKRVKRDLVNGKNVIYDATNISYKRRMEFLAELKNIICEKIAIIIATPYWVCDRDNCERERKVPEDVILRMRNNFNVPYWYEGWDQILIERHFRVLDLLPQFYQDYKNFDQENKHHTETLGNHCLNVCSLLQEKGCDKLLQVAGYLHDCGKPYTKSFKNGKGEITSDAHYFQHHCVGAYESLFYMTSVNQLDLAVLIQWHMQPYFWEKDLKNGEKQRLKYLKLWGDELYSRIIKLHEADVMSH